MVSMAESGHTGAEVYVCSPPCGKSFARLCDLNKHAKSHTRPFKCAISTCKYHEHGWPTAKELERHVNDKHSAAPKTFACLFTPCTYRSKRESNCKQHMEKTHRWNYIRSKSNGKSPTSQHQVGLSYHLQAEPFTAAGSISPSPNHALIPPPPGSDFVLYPQEFDHSIMVGEGDDDREPGYDQPQDQDSQQVFLPWTSPTTRIRNNESFIEMFTQTYNGDPDRPVGDRDALVNPSLSQYTPADLRGPFGSELPNFLPDHHSSVKVEPISTTADGLGSVKLSRASVISTKSSSEALNMSTAQTSQSLTRSQKDHIEFPGTLSQASQVTNSLIKPTLGRRRGREEDNDDSRKRRHLSRPAHRLQVTERIISSFTIDEKDYPHPRLGLCRRCWRVFDEQQALEDHLSSLCGKVSKGKREKWRILRDTFTPLVNIESELGVFDGDNAEQPSSYPNSYLTLNEDSDARTEPKTPSTSVPSPATIDRAINSPMVSAPDRNFVSLTEVQRLRREHRELNKRLEQVTKALFVRNYQDSLRNSPQASSGTSMAMRNGQLPDNMSPNVGPGAPSVGQMDLTSDQERLVLHMNSQSTDVDVEGLMHEASETLSRQNSGLSSSSRSTVHHVPTSPPPLAAENAHTHVKGGGSRRLPLPPSSRHQPTSIPDSGYETSDPRRCSLGERDHFQRPNMFSIPVIEEEDDAKSRASAGQVISGVEGANGQFWTENSNHGLSASAHCPDGAAPMESRHQQPRRAAELSQEISYTNPFDSPSAHVNMFVEEETPAGPYDTSSYHLGNVHHYNSQNQLDMGSFYTDGEY
ncbi:hypothetical protein B0T17DRAFT_507255 [Bombardia bombarda]|uniref:C2H2-type domain-containing protein n=1 Tax=Bombardia bombarda TaxID=252184 RepID=A0AA39XBE8_9PEZI|nr:hypothetical protein B0T17DRAFT_507255 [Bombardia bombarda]